MKILNCLCHSIDTINEWVGKTLSYLIIFIAGILCYEVVFRYGLDKPTIWVHETSQFLFGGYMILAGGYTLCHNGHINMDILYAHLPLRWKAIFDLFSWSLFFLFCGTMLWVGGSMAWLSVSSGEYSQSTWGPPVWPVRLTIPLGALLILLQGVTKYIRVIITVVTGKEAS